MTLPPPDDTDDDEGTMSRSGLAVDLSIRLWKNSCVTARCLRDTVRGRCRWEDEIT